MNDRVRVALYSGMGLGWAIAATYMWGHPTWKTWLYWAVVFVGINVLFWIADSVRPRNKG